MSTIVAIVVVAIIVVVVVAALWYRSESQRRTRDHLRGRFGDEYERVAAERGEPAAQRDLATRERRVEGLPIRELNPDERARFAEAWRSVQARFVDDPEGSVSEADMLVGQVMETRGYPVADFEQRAADVSVNHPDLVRNYRAAHQIATNTSSGGRDRTEDLRNAMVYYRSLFNELLGPDNQGRAAANPAA